MSVNVLVRGLKLTHKFHIPIETTVGDLKQMIENWCGAKVERQYLYEEEKILTDDFQFKYHLDVIKGRDENKLEQVLLNFFLNVPPFPGDPEFTIWLKSKFLDSKEIKVRETLSVEKFRKRVVIAMNWAVSPSSIILITHNEVMFDHCSLSEYYINSNSVIEVGF